MTYVMKANQLLPQLLKEHFDTWPSQFRHIENIHEEVKKQF